MTNGHFIKFGLSRETSQEVLEAILQVAAGNETVAERIWETPTAAETLAVWNILQTNGTDESGYHWGAEGINWAPKA
ncbi:hypothetical protein EUV02_03965 [Polymorphobacter arshaanensis]|uniref:Uncharacterized protein n=1 Tax=Glacieibacterium arshaanense TaxID=2511025 RepID=A0A4Y9ERA4_9SPHN|nr:YccJ family protein [Polymorphobacter arshaanensis]TFU06177.1 hypothetical protein EUV02_03965 [Polymorphobacter arshaanensis]